MKLMFVFSFVSEIREMCQKLRKAHFLTSNDNHVIRMHVWVYVFVQWKCVFYKQTKKQQRQQQMTEIFFFIATHLHIVHLSSISNSLRFFYLLFEKNCSTENRFHKNLLFSFLYFTFNCIFFLRIIIIIIF